MKTTVSKPASKPAAKKSAGKPKRVTPAFLSTLSKETQEIYRAARKLRHVLA